LIDKVLKVQPNVRI